MMQGRKENGFTLIELVMVIVILGILAAFALPRFADLGSDARVSTIQGAAGAIKSAAAIAHSKALAAGETGATGTITLEGANIGLVYGYPSKDAILAAAQISDDDFDVNPNGTTPATIRAKGATTPAQCQVTYAEATSDGKTPPVITAPKVNVVVTGC
jgi:MSHA pilin protein MshA